MADKTNSYQDYQDAQSQLLNIQAQQQANLQEARLMGQSQMATNNVLNQAAQVAAQTVAMGNTTQPATFNPTTQAVLQQYGLGQPRVVRTQNRTQNTTPQHVTINNNTSNITNNNVSVPANIGGPLQGRPVQINPDIQMGGFKTWLSNVFAQQNAEAARRDREYERRESALTRNANRVLKKIGEIGGNIGKALDPRRMTNNNVNTIKTLFTVLGIANLAKNWTHVAHKLDGFFNWLGIKGSGSRSEGDTVWDSLRKNIVKLLGGQSEGDNAEGVLIAIRRLFYTKEGEDSINGRGIFNEILDRIKLELNYRFKSAGLSLEKYKDGLKNSNNSGDKLVSKLLNVASKFTGALGAMINGFISGDASSVVNKINDENVNERHQYDFMDVESYNHNRKNFDKSTNKYGIVYKTDENGKLILDKDGNPIEDKDSKTKGFTYSKDVLATDRNGKKIGGMIEAVWNEQDQENPNVFVQKRKLINPSSLEMNNTDKIISNTTENNLKSGDKANNLNHAKHLDKNGDLTSDTAAFNLSLDVIQILINQTSGDGYNYDTVVSYLQKLDRYLSKKKRVPVCRAWPEFFPKKEGDKPYEEHLYKRIPKIWTVNLIDSEGAPNYDDSSIIPKWLGNVANGATFGGWAAKAGIPASQLGEFKNNYTDALFIVPAAGPEDVGIDHVVYLCVTITRKELLDVIKRYMNLSENTELKNLQGYGFQKDMRNAMYRKTAESIKNNKSFSQQYSQKMNEFADLDAAKKEYQEGKEALKEEEFRYEKAYDYFKNETVLGQALSKGIEKGEEIYQQGMDKLTGFKTRSEFIDKLRPIIMEKLNELDLPEENIERYADILLSQLALESAWGKKPSGENNFGGIKAPTEKDEETGKRVPKDKEHAKEVITREVLDGNLKKYPKLRDRVVEEPYQELGGRWIYKIKDWFKTYDSVEDFVDDYINLLNNNWSDAINGRSDLSDNELIEHYATNLKKGKNGGSYYTADVEKYTDLLNKIYSSVKAINKRRSQEQNKENNNEAGGPESGVYSEIAYKNPLYDKIDSEKDLLAKSIEEYSNAFNVKNAVDVLRSNTNKVFQQTKRATKLGLKVGDTKQRKDSIGLCAGHVRRAIEAGGIKTKNRPSNANGYIKYLPTIGFTEVSGNSVNQPGDISIEEATTTHPDGHAAMWDGYNWISDFAQKSQVVHKTDAGKLHKFRYTGGTRLNSNYIPSESIREVSSYEIIPEDKTIAKINSEEIKKNNYTNITSEDNTDNTTSDSLKDTVKQVGDFAKEDLKGAFYNAIKQYTDIISKQSNSTSESGSEENNSNNSNTEILSILNKILSIQTNISYNTAATATEVRTNTEVTAQQINRPIETRGVANSMLNTGMNSNYGG